MYNDTEEKVRNLEWESNLFNNPKDLVRVGMLNCFGVVDDKTTIATYAIETCVALGVVAADKNGVVHRIVTHNPYTGEYITKRFEDGIKDYLQALGEISKLDVIMCSMASFNDFSRLDEREQEILDRIGSIFDFWKEANADFHIPFHQSWYIKISPQGFFEYADSEMIDIYRKLESENDETARI